jgi:hypothetical protein
LVNEPLGSEVFCIDNVWPGALMIDPITDDPLNEGTETIHLALSGVGGTAVLGPRDTATLVINPSDGVAIPGTPPKGQKPSGTFTDADGDLVTITLGGKVAGSSPTYYLTNGVNGAVPKSNGPLAEIDLTGTDPTKATVTVTVKTPKTGGGDGRVQLGEVDGTGFKTFTGKACDLVGAGFNLVGGPTGYAGAITVANVSGGADFELGGALPAKAKGTKITAGVIADGTDINVTAGRRA